MDSKLFEVFPQLQMDDSDRQLLKDTQVVKISVPDDRSSVLIYLKNDDELSGGLVRALEDSIREAVFAGKSIPIHIAVLASGRSEGGSAEVKAAPLPGQSGFRQAKTKWTPVRNKKSNDPNIVYGYDFSGESLPVSSLSEGMGEVILSGSVFEPETIRTKNGKYIFRFNLTDCTDSVGCRLFCDENAIREIEDALTEGTWISLTGVVNPPNQFSQDITVGNIRSIKKIQSPLSRRMDHYEGPKRVELSLHTKMSDMDGISTIDEYIKRAAEWGWDAIALTDSNDVQAFPAAAAALKKSKAPLKLIYGCDGSIVYDEKETVKDPRGQSLDGAFVVFDLETTGLSMDKCTILEIGAVKISGGLVTERFSRFIDPGVHIPEHITKLTGIRDQDVAGQGDWKVHLPEFLEFVGDLPVVGHNAAFDTDFVAHFAAQLGIRFQPTVVDTLGLSHMLLKHLNRYRLDNVARELGVSLSNHHRAVYDAEATAGIFLRFIDMLKKQGLHDLDEVYAAEVIDDSTVKKLHASPFSILVRNDLGRTNLYRLVSAAHIDYYSMVPRMPASVVNSLRDGLLLGSGNEESELYDLVMRGVDDAELDRFAAFFDYLEVIPPSALAYMIKDNRKSLDSLEDIRRVNERIVRLGERLGIPVCATGNVHFTEPEDSSFRKIIRYAAEISSKGRGDDFDEERALAPVYLRTTEEMLDEFAWLGPEKAREIVIGNPRALAERCEQISPVRPDKCPPVIENSDNELRDSCYGKAHEMYGDPLPELIRERLDKELQSIISNGYSVMYIIAKRLVEDSNEHGYLVGSRGSVGSSLAATFAGISEVNPLPPHYRCPSCHYVDFDSEQVKAYKNRAGCDMPDAVCPRCGAPLLKDGFDIPFETFLGFKGDKEPDIDLNFSGDYQPKAHAYTEVLFGTGQTYKAGTTGAVQDKTAYGYVERYNEDHNIEHMRRAEVSRLAKGCTEVKRTTGQHPGGIVVLPHGEEMNSFTPIQHPANVMDSPIITHFDYHSIEHNLLKLDILGKDDPTMARMLKDLTGIDPMDVPVGVPEVLSLFQKPDALGLKPEDIGGTLSGTLGIPEFGTDFAIAMLMDARPKYVSDLVRIAGLAHGTDVWIGNAQKLIQEGKCTIQTAICTRDDIMLYLIEKGIDPGTAFKIMELVRKGKFPKDAGHEEYCRLMSEHGVPDWYIWSCDTIKYMFPKAHAAAYVVMSLRIAYYKIHYPKEYYTAYFTVKGTGFNYEKMFVTLDGLRAGIRQLRADMESGKSTTENDKLLLRDMRIAEEMMARGISFAPIDIFKAKASAFSLTPDGRIMPSLSSIAGLGKNAAESIEKDAVNGPYLSVEEFTERTKVNRSNADLLKRLGLLGSIPESNQLSIFDLF